MDQRYNEFHMHVILILRSHFIHSQPIKGVNLQAEVFLVITEFQFYLNLWASILSVKFTAFRIQNLDKKFMEISVPIFFHIIFIFLYISIQYSSESEVFTHMYQYAPFQLMEASL